MVLVKKQNGQTEQFDPEKLIRGLTRAGATPQTADKVLKAIKKDLYPGITTREIFAIAFREFRRQQPVTSTKYKIKDALMMLGKSGFPFESFIERIMIHEGYRTQRNLVARGKVIPHEIDVKATKGSEVLMIECKHRKKPWLSTPIQTGLYVYARFLDVKGQFTKPMVATNTKFSPQVIKYAKGVGMRLLGWHYPRNESLEKLIEKHKAYPVTLLPNITPEMLDVLLKKDMVMLRDLEPMSENQLSKLFGISNKKAQNIIKMCTLCNQ